eukprot:6201239-Pleurochrysis_carterae.AAC.1
MENAALAVHRLGKRLCTCAPSKRRTIWGWSARSFSKTTSASGCAAHLMHPNARAYFFVLSASRGLPRIQCTQCACAANMFG